MSSQFFRNLIAAPVPSAVALGAAAATALLAGCSGGSQYAPSATTGSNATATTSLAHHSASRVAMPFASQLANEAFLHRPIVNDDTGRITVRHDIPCNRPLHGLTFASENTTGRLDVFCGARGPYHIHPGQAPFLSIAGVAGWGVAVHGAILAVGQTGGNIKLYKLPSLGLITTQSLTTATNNAYGLAFDHNGGLYATEFPGQLVDYWSNPIVASPPNCTWTTTVNTVDYHVAAHGANSVVVYGYNGNSPSGDVDTELVTNMPSCSGITDAFVENFGQTSQGTGFPGGIVSSKSGELYINNQYGTLYDDGTYPGSTVVSSCSWGYDPNDIANINLATKQQSVWGANINFGGAPIETFLESFAASISSGSCASGSVSGPTIAIPTDEYAGVASWPNQGN